MVSLIKADLLKLRRYWLPWALLVLLILSTGLQIRGKVIRLAELEAKLASQPTSEDNATGFEAFIEESDRREVELLGRSLTYPAVIGLGVRLATNVGIFFLILLTAVSVGEDFSRRTLSSLLARGIGRGRYLVAHSLSLWIVAGVAILVVTALSAAAGPIIHTYGSGQPISLVGLGDSILFGLRAWLVCLPFISAVAFWAVLGRHAGPAMGVGIGLHALEYLMGLMIPIFGIAMANGAEIPFIYQLLVRLQSVTLGFNADVFLNWGSPLTMSMPIGSPLLLGADAMLSLDPWRALTILSVYVLLFSGWTVWILHRRDVSYGG